MRSILIILFFILSIVSKAQLKEITATNKVGQTWLITGSISTKNINLTITKEAVGLSLVSNVSDAMRPLSAAAKLDSKGKTDSLKYLYSANASLKADIASMKAEIVLLKKKDTFFISDDSLKMGVVGTKLNPLNLNSIRSEIAVIQEKLDDLGAGEILLTRRSEVNQYAKLSARLTKLSKRIYRVERKLFGNKPPIKK